MLPANTLLQGRYQIVAQIGRGGMGAVYRAIDTRLRNAVALKQTLVEGEVARRAFEREAQLLAGMRHAALPKVIDHFTEEQGQFLVMEFIPGDDLGALLATRGEPFSVPEVIAWGDRLLDALEYLHGHTPPIIHRDIKPQNMKLTDRGEIILLDFGLAKGASSGQATRSATTASIYGYTPHYAPLEQIQGTGTGPRSDLYGLAATMHHLLTGTPPPDALTRAAARINEEPDPLKPANELNPEVPAAIAGVLMQALSQKPDQRPESAVVMRRMLRDAARGGSATTRLIPEAAAPTAGLAGPASPTIPIGAAARPGTAPLPAEAGQLASGTTLSGPGQATKQLPTQAPAPSGRPWLIPAAVAALLLVAVAALFGTGVIGGRAAPTAVPTSAAAPTEPALAAAPTSDVVGTARAEVIAEGTATAQAAATETAVIQNAIASVDSTRTAVAAATIAAASDAEQTALAQTAAVVALSPSPTIEAPATQAPATTKAPAPTKAPTATRDPNAPTSTPRPAATPTPAAAPTNAPAPSGKAAVLAQGGGSEFRGSASIGTIDPSQGDGGSCIQGKVLTQDGGTFDSFLVGIDKGGALRKVSYDYRSGFFGACGLDAGDWGVVVYKAGGKDTSPSDQGAHQVRLRLTGTPGEVAFVNFKAVGFSVPTPTPTPVAGPYDGVWAGTISGKTSGGTKDFTGRFRMEVRANAVYSISVDGADCLFDTYPNFPNGQAIDGDSFAVGGQVFHPSDKSTADISYSVNGRFSSTTAASGTMSASRGGGQCLIGSWSARR